MKYFFRDATKKESALIKQITELQGRYTKYWDSGRVLLFCAKTDGDILGWVRHWHTKMGINAIMSLTINEAYRGHKLGLLLTSQLIQTTPDVDLWYMDCKGSLANYYKALGFKEIDRAEVPELLNPDEWPEHIAMAGHTSDVTAGIHTEST